MRACVLVDVGRFEVRDVPDPALEPHMVRVAPHAIGVCGTDFHIHAGEFNFNLDEVGRPIPLTATPQILGHEISGVVEDVGAEVADLRAGDRVVLDQGLSCVSKRREPRCEYCASGDSHQCDFYTEHGITGLPGGFAEHVCIPAVNAVRIESELGLEAAALTEPLACVLHSLQAASQASARYPLRSAKTALVLGAGPAGLLFVQALRNVFGFEGRLLVCDLNPKKRALAATFGAEPVAPESLVEDVLERTGGRRAELLIEATGSGEVFADIPALTRKQATVLLYGVGHGDGSLQLLNQVQWKEPTLVTSIGASGGFDPDGRPQVYRRALQAIERKEVEVALLVSHRYAGLDAVAQAFGGDHGRPDYVKGVVLLS